VGVGGTCPLPTLGTAFSCSCVIYIIHKKHDVFWNQIIILDDNFKELLLSVLILGQIFFAEREKITQEWR
jgi:hypothetical protein